MTKKNFQKYFSWIAAATATVIISIGVALLRSRRKPNLSLLPPAKTEEIMLSRQERIESEEEKVTKEQQEGSKEEQDSLAASSVSDSSQDLINLELPARSQIIEVFPTPRKKKYIRWLAYFGCVVVVELTPAVVDYIGWLMNPEIGEPRPAFRSTSSMIYGGLVTVVPKVFRLLWGGPKPPTGGSDQLSLPVDAFDLVSQASSSRGMPNEVDLVDLFYDNVEILEEFFPETFEKIEELGKTPGVLSMMLYIKDAGWGLQAFKEYIQEIKGPDVDVDELIRKTFVPPRGQRNVETPFHPLYRDIMRQTVFFDNHTPCFGLGAGINIQEQAGSEEER